MLPWSLRGRSLSALLPLMGIGLLVGLRATPVLAHDPIVTQPRVLVMQPGESATVVLEMVNLSGPAEPPEDVRRHSPCCHRWSR